MEHFWGLLFQLMKHGTQHFIWNNVHSTNVCPVGCYLPVTHTHPLTHTCPSRVRVQLWAAAAIRVWETQYHSYRDPPWRASPQWSALWERLFTLQGQGQSVVHTHIHWRLVSLDGHTVTAEMEWMERYKTHGNQLWYCLIRSIPAMTMSPSSDLVYIQVHSV